MADDIAKLAREALDQAWSYDRENRKEMAEDLKFIAGFQWPEAAQRERVGRPMITINRSGQFLRQVSNPIRQNMPTLKVIPIDDRSDRKMGAIYNGILRQIQYNSSASHVYANAVEHAVGCGIGWFRVLTDYVDDQSFDQELMVKRIPNPLSVYADPASVEPDRSTMNFCLVSEMIPLETFKKRWKGKSIEGLDAPTDQKMQTTAFWQMGDNVRVAEFWRRQEVKKTLARLKNGQTVELTDMGEAEAGQLMESGLVVGTRSATGYKVTMTLVSGNEQLEETYECPCKWIPVIPIIGAEVPLENGVYRHGVIRFQREPQQLHNYFLSIAAESLGQQPKAPYIVDIRQVQKVKDLWDAANKVSLPYLPYESVKDVPPPQRVSPPPLPAGLVQMAQMFSDDMKAATGIYDAALGNRSNETSGVAIRNRIQQGDQATFHYVDNLEHSLEHLGRVLIDMIPKVYDTRRVMRFVAEDGSESEEQINVPTISVDGQPQVLNDLSAARFDVRVVLGPNYATRRQEAMEGLLELAKADPRLFEIGGDIIVKSMDFPGSEELAERYKAILPPPIMQLEEGGQAGPPMPPPPDPMQEFAMQAQMQQGQDQLAISEANVAKAQAEADTARGNAERSQHQAQGALADVALKMRQLREPPPTRQGLEQR